jgi:hypothetical protein
VRSAHRAGESLKESDPLAEGDEGKRAERGQNSLVELGRAVAGISYWLLSRSPKVCRASGSKGTTRRLSLLLLESGREGNEVEKSRKEGERR